MPSDKTYNKIYHEGLGQWIGIKTKKGTRLLEQMINNLYGGIEGGTGPGVPPRNIRQRRDVRPGHLEVLDL